MLVPLQGAAAGCRCRVLLEGAAVRVACALWSGHAGALQRVVLDGAAVTVVSALWMVPRGGVLEGAGLGTWVLLQGTAVRVRWAL